MRKKLWIHLALLLVIPGLLFTASCAKKTVKSTDTSTSTAAEEQSKQADEAAVQAREQQAAAEAAAQMAEDTAQRDMLLLKNMFESESIYYDFDSAALSPVAQGILSGKADYLRDNPGTQVIVEGHCDERGTPEYNLALGDRRAESAKSFLINLGIDASRFTTVSYGEESPVDTGHDEEAWAKNRRAKFLVE
ncbi:MAG: peptidoglycan-associated lipoprotein Pal [Desulfobacterales bacterium]|nr:peptidoglycan-associated lipoprotein Pal [Desulfobacterales bacterium]